MGESLQIPAPEVAVMAEPVRVHGERCPFCIAIVPGNEYCPFRVFGGELCDEPLQPPEGDAS